MSSFKKWPDIDICCSDNIFVQKDGTLSEKRRSNWPDTPSSPVELFLLKAPPFPACEMYKASTVKNYGGFDQEMKAFTDSTLRVRMILDGCLVVRTEGGYAVYRPVENSITKSGMKIYKYGVILAKQLLKEKYGKSYEIKLLIEERLLRHRFRYWHYICRYHLSLNPLAISKLIYHILKATSVDLGFLYFVFYQKPWKLSEERLF